jgi:hypothetical protein
MKAKGSQRQRFGQRQAKQKENTTDLVSSHMSDISVEKKLPDFYLHNKCSICIYHN